MLKADAQTGMAYFLVMGSPEVTIKFPWSELVIIVLIMLIIIRLLFKKQVGDVEKYVEEEVKKDTKYAQEKFVDIGKDFRDAQRKVADAKKNVSENVSHEVDKIDEVAKEIEKMPKKYYEYYKRKYDKIFEEK